MNEQNVRDRIKAYQALLALMQQPEGELSLEQLTFRKYIEFEKLADTAKYLRENGRRLANGNSIQPNHVSEILDTLPENLDRGVIRIAQTILGKHRSFAARIWG